MYIHLHSLFTHNSVLIIFTVNIAYGIKCVFLTFSYFLRIGRTFCDTNLCAWRFKTPTFKPILSSDKQTGSQALHTAVLASDKLFIFAVLPGTCALPSLSCINCTDRLCGLVFRVSGYRYRGLGFDSRRYQIFWVVVGLERGPLSLVRSIEELLE